VADVRRRLPSHRINELPCGCAGVSGRRSQPPVALRPLARGVGRLIRGATPYRALGLDSLPTCVWVWPASWGDFVVGVPQQAWLTSRTETRWTDCEWTRGRGNRQRATSPHRRGREARGDHSSDLAPPVISNFAREVLPSTRPGPTDR
jgi:hypothetical protein